MTVFLEDDAALVFVFIHREYCDFCGALRKEFSRSFFARTILGTAVSSVMLLPKTALFKEIRVDPKELIINTVSRAKRTGKKRFHTISHSFCRTTNLY